MDEDLKKLEEDLGKLSPLGMPDDLLARLNQAMCRWHEHVPEEEKVVSFQTTNPEDSREAAHKRSAPSRRTSAFPGLASAAVAVLGVVSANFYWQKDSVASPEAVADIQNASVTPSAAAATEAPGLAARSGNSAQVSGNGQAHFLPVSAKTNAVNAADRGIVYMPNGQAARRMAIHYQDQVEYKNEKGEILKLNKPELKVIYLPLKTD